MYLVNDNINNNPYIHYYSNQIGGGDITPQYFRGFINQRGYGFFSSIFKVLGSGLKSVGKAAVKNVAKRVTKDVIKKTAKQALKHASKHALSTGMDIMSDMINEKKSFKNALKQRSKQKLGEIKKGALSTVKRKLEEHGEVANSKRARDIFD
jgi:hypothetical protein